MDIIEKAYRVLGVSSGASGEEIREAYEELKRVWDPSRFADDPEMMAKSKVRMKQIDEAHRLLRLRGRRTITPPSHPWLEEKKRKRQARSRGNQNVDKRARSENEGSPSLFDDAFSERVSDTSSRFPLWAVISAILLVSAALIFVLNDGASVSPASGTESTSAAMKASSIEAAGRQLESERPESPGEEAPVDGRQPPSNDSDRVLRDHVSSPISTASPSSEMRDTEVQERKEKPQLLRDESIPAQGSPSETAQLQTSVGDEGIESLRAQQAFQLLKEGSQAARELVSSQVPDLRFVSWKALPKEADELWLDLTAEVLSSGEEIHFIWAVDPNQKRVRAMSQAARNLELGRTRM